MHFTTVNYSVKKKISPSVLLGLSKDQTSDHCTLSDYAGLSSQPSNKAGQGQQSFSVCRK